VLTVSGEQSVGAGCGRFRGGYWTVVEALIPTGSIAAVHTCSGLTPAPSSTTPELPRQYNLIRVVAFGSAVMTSGFLTYLMGCGVKRNDHFKIKTRHHHFFTRRYGNSVQTTEGNDNESILFRSI